MSLNSWTLSMLDACPQRSWLNLSKLSRRVDGNDVSLKKANSAIEAWRLPLEHYWRRGILQQVASWKRSRAHGCEVPSPFSRPKRS